jgi:diaminohydroxyphosphoribosylaminopyrimidine deaminase/5-amino-6-(5-phosphoribosylamino)uracil reductase
VNTKTPFVILKCAATLDGRIATRIGDARWISNALSRNYVHELRHAVDAILVGMGTIRADNPRLTTRLPQGINGKKAKDPLRIILDPRFSIAEDATVLRIDSDSDTVIVTGSMGNDPAWENKRKRLEKMGARVISAPVHEGRIDLKALMTILGEMAVTSLLIEGGSHVLASALAHGIVDKVLFFYAPKLLGGDDGIPICTGFGPAHMEESLPVKDICVKRFGDDVLIEGYMKS